MTDPMFSTPIGARTLRDLPVVPRGFYQRQTETVARELLGKIVIRRSKGEVAGVRLTEVEAYLGAADRACHTYGGRRTDRVRTMWGPAGHAYVYLIYGMHHCLNVVTVGPGVGEAVLIRGGVPVTGLGVIRTRRGCRVRDGSLCDGPGKLCRALAITRDDDGADLCDRAAGLWVCDDGLEVPAALVDRSPRVGVGYAGDAAAWPLRFRLKIEN